MALPILVTLPLGDAKDERAEPQERQRIQVKLLEQLRSGGDVIEPVVGEQWCFYPYRNPNPSGQSLTPTQLCDVLRDELDLFLPTVESFEELQHLFKDGSCSQIEQRYRHPFVPDRQAKDEQSTRWISDRIAIVLDDPQCRWVKLFRVSTFDMYRRTARQFNRKNKENGDRRIRIAPEDALLLEEMNASDTDEQGNWIGDAHVNEQGAKASTFLGRLSARDCTLRGIEATYALANDVGLKVINLQQANMDFDEIMQEPSESELHRLA